ncbi:tRNA uridine-5-carboxymethylaminomethyl(34) synthesis GTPase MnmE [Sphingorhabdus contaminans]|uniref:tRNA uridine-5-carboxymethylaminomethyl(34) synthesis GTPase MnmE n=1 Tax=Sphingorhabdus contaminans TaxID=1343899 RepID=UPI003D2D4C6C
MPAGDTIFALSSGAPPAAIAVLRISGPSAVNSAEALAGSVPEARRASLRTLRDASGEVLDRALLLVFPGPDSATGEDLVELHVHGGRAVVRAVSAALAAMPGLRAAEPGEFTRRAFLNGRMDLNEAEGLADLLSAETEWQRRAAGAMMGGAFSRRIEQWRQDVLALSALTEAELDFSDEGDVDTQNNVEITDSCKRLHDAICTLVHAPGVEKLRDGLRVVLGGPPNSGKSTLLNALVARDAAIVSDIAGTTRDVIEVPVSIGGIAFLFLDTAGLRDTTDDRIEAIGIERTHAAMESADILLWLGEEGAGPDHPNLVEIEAKADDPAHLRKDSGAVKVSAKTEEGMADLVATLTEKAKGLLPPPDQFAINVRQRTLLAQCADALQQAAEAQDWLITAENLRQARLALDAMTGRAHTEDLLDTLFGRFCVGK